MANVSSYDKSRSMFYEDYEETINGPDGKPVTVYRQRELDFGLELDKYDIKIGSSSGYPRVSTAYERDIFQRAIREKSLERAGSPGHAGYRLVTGTYTHPGVLPEVSLRFGTVDVERLKALCINEMLEQIKATNFNTGVFKAELSQTRQMVGDLTRNISTDLGANLEKGMRRFRMRKHEKNPLLRKAAVAAEIVSSAWLGMQYGIKPLLQDAYSAGATLAELQNPKPLRQNVRVTRTAHYIDTVPVPRWGESTVSYSCDAIVRAYATFETTEAVQIAQKLGLMSPAEVAWEALTLSFVADWFANFGQYLSLLNATQGVRLVDGGINAKVKQTSSFALHRVDRDDAIRAERSYTGRLERTTFSRRPWTSWPLPVLVNKPDHSLTHMLSGIALLTSFTNPSKLALRF